MLTTFPIDNTLRHSVLEEPGASPTASASGLECRALSQIDRFFNSKLLPDRFQMFFKKREQRRLCFFGVFVFETVSGAGEGQ